MIEGRLQEIVSDLKYHFSCNAFAEFLQLKILPSS